MLLFKDFYGNDVAVVAGDIVCLRKTWYPTPGTSTGPLEMTDATLITLRNGTELKVLGSVKEIALRVELAVEVAVNAQVRYAAERGISCRIYTDAILQQLDNQGFVFGDVKQVKIALEKLYTDGRSINHGRLAIHRLFPGARQ